MSNRLFCSRRSHFSGRRDSLPLSLPWSAYGNTAVFRTTIYDESHAAWSALDIAWWLQAFLVGIATLRFLFRHLSPSSELPIRNPFGGAPPGREVETEWKFPPREMKATSIIHPRPTPWRANLLRWRLSLGNRAPPVVRPWIPTHL